MNDKITDIDIKGFLNSWSAQIDADNKKDYAQLITTIKNIIKVDGTDNMDRLDLFFMYPVNSAAELAVEELYPDAKNSHALAFLFIHYQFVANFIEKIIVRREGTPCSVDKSSWLIRSMAEYYINGIMPDMFIPDGCFWKPHFGLAAEWMEYIDSLQHLYYGNPDRYLKALMVFLKPESNQEK